MAEQQLFKTTLLTPDFVDMQYKETLTSKVDELLKQYNVKKMETIKRQSICEVVTDTALRRNKTGKPNHLDQRRTSQHVYVKKGLLTGTTGTLKDNEVPGLDLESRYNVEKNKLFNKLSNRFPETSFLTNTEEEEDESRKGVRLFIVMVQPLRF